MSRIPYPVVKNLADDVRKIVEHANLNALTMFAHATPQAFVHFYPLMSAFFTVSKLPADLRQIAILRAGHIAGSYYVTRQHTGLARDVGLSDAAIKAVEQGNSPAGVLTPAQHAAMVFADELIRNANASDATLAEMRRHLDDNQLMDLMMVISIYMMLSRLILVSGAEVDAHSMGTGYLDHLHN